MVAFNFKERFAPLVEAKIKLQTIRREARAKPGVALQLYTGQRTRACRKLVTPDPICTRVDYVGIRPDGLTFGIAANWPDRADEFAKLDGFKDFDDMLSWFTETYGSPYFQGVVHSWAPDMQISG